MGGCCSTENSDSQTELAATAALHPLTPAKGPYAASPPIRTVGGLQKVQISPAAIQEFMNRALTGFDTLVLLSSGLGLECNVRVDPTRKRVLLSKEELCKEVPFASITKILHTPEDLARVRTEAKLDSHCCALYTAADSSCIVFYMDSPEEVKAFVGAAERFISA